MDQLGSGMSSLSSFFNPLKREKKRWRNRFFNVQFDFKGVYLLKEKCIHQLGHTQDFKNLLNAYQQVFYLFFNKR